MWNKWFQGQCEQRLFPYTGGVEWRIQWVAPSMVVVMFLVLALCSAGKPPGSDEFWFLQGAKDLALTGIPWRTEDGGSFILHPPLYPYLVALSYHVFGFYGMSAKLVGILCACGMLWVAGRFLAMERRGVWPLGLLLIALNPLFIQGSVLLDSDNTVLSLLLILFILGWIRLDQGGEDHDRPWKWGFLFGASLWAKLTTPLLLGALLVGFMVIRRKLALLLHVLIPAFIVGLIFFAGTFWVYCQLKSLAWTQPFEYLVSAFRAHSSWNQSRSNIVEVGKNQMELLLWFQPSLVILFGWAVIMRLRAISQCRDFLANDLLWIFATAVTLGYLVVGGTNFGFPRYSFPALIPICLVVWSFAASSLASCSGRWGRIFILCVGLTVFQMSVVSDPLHTFRYVIRDALIQGTSLTVPIGQLAGQVIAGVVVPLIAWRLYFKRETGLNTLRVALFFTALTQCAGLDVKHAVAAYNTNYNYGETGSAEVVATIARSIAPGQRVVATLEITGGLTWEGLSTRKVSNSVWNDADILERQIRDPNTEYVVYSITSNTVAQHRNILAGSRVQAALQGGFEAARIGGYTVWRRVRK